MADAALDVRLGTALDTSALGTRLLQDIGGPATALAGVSFTADTSALGGAAVGAEADGSPLAGAVDRLRTALGPALASLPIAGDIVRPLESSVALIEQLTHDDLVGKIQSLGARLGAEFDGSREGGLLGVLLRIANELGGAPEGKSVVDLLFSVLAVAGVDRPGRLPFGDELAAADGGVRTLGGLMALESVLSESERLTGLLSRQLDVDALDRHIALAEQALGGGGVALASFVAGLAPDDAPGVTAAIAATTAFVERIETLRRDLTTGLAFGDATLAYLDVDKVQAEIELALDVVRGVDLAPLGRLAARGAGAVAPFVAFDLGNAAARGLEGLLAEAEGKVAELVTAVGALDVVGLVGPIRDGIGKVTGVLRQVSDVIHQITVAFQGAVGAIRDVVTALPFGDIANAIRAVLAPLAQVIDVVRTVIASVKTALKEAADAVNGALGQIDGVLESFKTDIDALFADAKTLIDQLDIGAVLGEISEGIGKFADLLAQAQMKPAFDAVTGVIGSTADVIGALPFDLLPESMKADVDAAVKPIKDVDAAAVESEIESLLQITDDGRFALDEVLRAAIADLQKEYERILDVIKGYDPRQVLADVDTKLKEISTKVQDLVPALTLEEVHQAVNRVRDAIVGFDIDGKLAPVREVFSTIETKLDEYKPGNLLAPVEQRLTEARASLLDAIRLPQWKPAIAGLSAQGLGLLDRFDPQRLGALLEGAFGQVGDLLARFPDAGASGGAGTLLTTLLAGTGLRVSPTSFPIVLTWIGGPSGRAALDEHAQRIAANVRRARDAVVALDLTARAPTLVAGAAALGPALATLRTALAESDPARAHLDLLVGRLDVAVTLGDLQANRSRLLAALEHSVILAETLQRSGFAEADTALVALRGALSPLSPALAKVRQLLSLLGLSGFEAGIAGVLRSLLAVVTPARLVGVVMPVFTAIRERVRTLLDAVLTPITDGITELETLIAAIDLQPLTDALDGIFDDVKAQIDLLHPDQVLKEPLDAWRALTTELVTADPVQEVIDILDGVRDVVAAVLDKLSLEHLLETPLAIYDELMAELGKLNIEGLLDPVFVELDDIAKQVDDGLDQTVSAFQRLQEALPGGGGGSSVSASVSVS